jgi:hypothetical protein
MIAWKWELGKRQGLTPAFWKCKLGKRQGLTPAFPARNLDEGGSGLGLSIVDNLVRTYGGEWSIRNVVGDGNTGRGLMVEIRLPILKALRETPYQACRSEQKYS